MVSGDRYARFCVLAIAAMLVAAAAPGGAALAQGAPPGLEVVARNLNNPRGLTIAPDGSLYVAEAGRGGRGPCMVGPEGGARICYGPTGAITRVANGRQVRVARGLASIAEEGGVFASGPSDVSVLAAGANVQQGGGGPQGGATPQRVYAVVNGLATSRRGALSGGAGRGFGRVVRLVPSRSGVANVKDLLAFEDRYDPDRDGFDSNPYSLAALPNGILAVDAGGNNLVRIDRFGRGRTVHVFPERLVPGPGGQTIPMDSVPDSVAVGPDGTYYVGELTGFPFPVRGARVYRKLPGRPFEVYARNFTNIIDVAVGRDGSVYVLELFRGGLLNANPQNPASLTGRLIRVYPNKRRVVLASEGLVAPGGVAVGRDNTVYVTNFSVLSGQGQVVRIRQ